VKTGKPRQWCHHGTTARSAGKVFLLKIKKKQENKETDPEGKGYRSRTTISLFLFVFKNNLLYHGRVIQTGFFYRPLSTDLLSPMYLPSHKTKIVCTIGPASDTPAMIGKMIAAGMNIARLNFSHGDFTGHARVINILRQEAERAGRRIAIMADLPGPKMRIGTFATEPVRLVRGSRFILTSEDITGDEQRVSISMPTLPAVVKQGDIIFLADGLIQLRVEKVQGREIYCRVEVGGELRSKKGVNIPGIDLGISVFTERDRECLRFALEHGVDAVSQSFVNSGRDIRQVRAAARAMGHNPFLIAKIERAGARDNIDSILTEADGIMVARGDLGVEIPIEEIAVAQKFITRKANLLGKPVITATQMLVSMTRNRRPTRAEATDVANAILDGTDCVMLSEESAMGQYPLESVQMLARIAAATEPHRPPGHYGRVRRALSVRSRERMVDALTRSVEELSRELESVAAVLAPTASGYTARSLSRFRLPVWILAVSASEKTCRELLFSSGVWPILEPDHSGDWTAQARDYAREFSLSGAHIIQTEGPSPKHPLANHRLEIIALEAGDSKHGASTSPVNPLPEVTP
jgi:pyruvate kinase